MDLVLRGKPISQGTEVKGITSEMCASAEFWKQVITLVMMFVHVFQRLFSLWLPRTACVAIENVWLPLHLYHCTLPAVSSVLFLHAFWFIFGLVLINSWKMTKIKNGTKIFQHMHVESVGRKHLSA